MLLVCAVLFLASLALALPLTILARSLGHRLNALDAPGVRGQLKAPTRRVPNTGGVAIFWAFSLPVLAALFLFNSPSLTDPFLELVPDLAPHVQGIRDSSPSTLYLLLALFLLHILGLIDDRKPLPALPKLLFMLAIAAAAAHLTNTRLLTALDPHLGSFFSLTLTVLWFVIVTNAFNFLDNMDGLSAGAAAVAAAFFLIAALANPVPQWFIAAALSLLLGSLAAFLLFNFPFRPASRGASIFMGDSGSLVLGFLLAFLSTRITYIPSPPADSTPHPTSLLDFFSSSSFPALFTPLVILAIPLYDFASVCAIRISQGKSPFVGDLQHFSHRLVNHGLSRRNAVLLILGCAAATGIAGVALPSLKPWQAALVLLQTLLILLVLAAYEWACNPQLPANSSGGPTP